MEDDEPLIEVIMDELKSIHVGLYTEKDRSSKPTLQEYFERASAVFEVPFPEDKSELKGYRSQARYILNCIRERAEAVGSEGGKDVA
jgi:hypothetical protein